MKWLAALASILVVGCAGHWKPTANREVEPALSRGWSFAEAEPSKIESGIPPVSYGGPVLAGEKLIAGSDRFGLTALSKKTGKVLWSHDLAEGATTLPLVADSKVYVGSGAGQLGQFDLETGLPGWSVSLGAPLHGSMVFALDRLFVATADEAVHAVDPATGKTLWTYRRPSFSGTSIRGGGNPSVVAGRLWIGFSDGALVSLDPQTGTLESEKIFRDNLKFMDLDAKVIGWKDGLLVSTYDGKLRHMKRDGSILWEFPAGSARAPLLTEGDTIFLPSSDGTLYSLSGSGGREMWRYAFRRGVPTSAAMVKHGAENLLVVTSSEEKIVVLNAATGKLVAESTFGRGSGSYAPIAVDGANFYVLSAYSRIYEFKLN